MQWSYDTKCNSFPTILLLIKERLYALGGLKAEGIFRINPNNSAEEFVRDQLNRGVVPENIDVHRLAGLIKAWFREMPSSVLDGISPKQVLQCGTEEEFVELIKQLEPPKISLRSNHYYMIMIAGDVGEWQPNGVMKIIDRKKNISKLSQGEYVDVESIESIYSQSPLAASVSKYESKLQFKAST
ncbi:rho GTPase-activating protein 2 [Phtheirospermum japonicum]|uniref:Rho GTPase-activating protein 2 n=1 Tax=Phtheirospermum japonicum TaxID=374723 RepID=A0A830DLS1_9LAMI|nr:rho GTPase-activating protein 2 [Phtheirospermum japonicum]